MERERERGGSREEKKRRSWDREGGREKKKLVKIKVMDRVEKAKEGGKRKEG